MGSRPPDNRWSRWISRYCKSKHLERAGSTASERQDADGRGCHEELTAHDIASEATWADEYRNRNIDNSRALTSSWHFVDIEIDGPNIDQACFDHPEPDHPASTGPAKDCVVDKIQEFADELANPDTDPEEQVVALKFLLHFVGDLHQPLHAADDHDRGANDKKVSASFLIANRLIFSWRRERTGHAKFR